MERNGRRGSLGRALLKLRDAIKRRRSSNGHIPTASSTSRPEKPIDRSPMVESIPVEPTKTVERPADVTGTGETVTSMGTPLIADTLELIEVDDTAEPLLPMLSTRTTFTNDRARKLFEKYGIKYEPPSNSTEIESSSDIRRVEKPIRIRIHWTCHDCNATFGLSKTCTSCGHRRCRECPRSPAKRVRQILETARQMQEQEGQPPVTAGIQQGTMNAPVVESILEDSTHAAMLGEATQGGEVEEDELNQGENVNLTQYQYVVQHRPRSGMQLVLRPKAQIVRRTCHECQTHFAPANRTDCQNCGHIRCDLCPRHPPKRETRTQGAAEDETLPAAEPKMVATVQRVYRKPRQRVRWTCDKCHVTFIDRERCRNCGHWKCFYCTRDPPQRVAPTPDPAVLQSVANKLTQLRDNLHDTH